MLLLRLVNRLQYWRWTRSEVPLQLKKKAILQQEGQDASWEDSLIELDRSRRTIGAANLTGVPKHLALCVYYLYSIHHSRWSLMVVHRCCRCLDIRRGNLYPRRKYRKDQVRFLSPKFLLRALTLSWTNRPHTAIECGPPIMLQAYTVSGYQREP